MSAAVSNRIDETLSRLRQEKRVGLMAHVIGGFPSLAATRELVAAMVESGADFIELQLPFSDPTADGPVITAACQEALDAGVRTEDLIEMMAEFTAAYPTCFLFMSYFNLVFRFRGLAPGTEVFAGAAAEAGAAGLIVPDIPPEETQEGYPEACRASGLHPIYVISPNIGVERFEALAKVASGFVYSTSRTGTTGKAVTLERQALRNFLDRARASIDLPLAVGFGLTERADVESLEGAAEIAVVGSHLIRVFRRSGIDGVAQTIRQLRGTGKDPSF